MGIHDGGVHSRFKLNGVSHTKEGIKQLCIDFMKGGTTFEKSMGSFLSNWLDVKPTIAVETSGSTGKPKKILLRKEQMVNSALATGEYFDLKEGNTALLCLPIEYIAGKMMLVRAMVLGLELDYVEPSSSPIAGLSKPYDFVAMVPLQLENSLKNIEMVKILIVGGASVSGVLKGKVEQKKTAIYETYGMTETITHVATKRINSGVELSESYFTALPNILFSKDNRECLVISAPRVSDKPVVTNDLVNIISDTEFELLGRFDNVINSGGIKLFPEQIEAKLTSLIRNRFFVTGIPDEKLGQKLILVLEGEIDTSKLMQVLLKFDGLERFEMPKRIYSIPKFLETDTGKIRRKENLLLIKK